MLDPPRKPVGLREQKRRQTLQRIAEVGLKSFLAKGYEATTLDDIAAAAGISRRTFFHYFRSKDDILLAYLDGYADALKASILESASTGTPLATVRDALIKLASRLQSSETIAIARLMRECEALRDRRQGRYLQLEEAAFDALSALWPAKKQRDRLRLAAMASIGTLRFAVDAWLQRNGKRPLAKHIEEAFGNLPAEIWPKGETRKARPQAERSRGRARSN